MDPREVPEEVAVVIIVREDPEDRGVTENGRPIQWSSFRIIQCDFTEGNPKEGMRKARLAILLSLVMALILLAYAVWIWRVELDIRSALAARVAAGISIVAIGTLIFGLYRILIQSSDAHAGRAQSREVGRPQSLMELHLEDHQSLSRDRARLALAIALSLHLGWLMPLGGLMAAVLGTDGTARAGGLVTGAGMGALALFVRRTMAPQYREIDTRLQRIRKEYGREVAKGKEG